MSADAFEPVAEQMLVVLSHYFQPLPLRRGALLAPERFRESPSKARRARCAVPAAPRPLRAWLACCMPGWLAARRCNGARP